MVGKKFFDMNKLRYKLSWIDFKGDGMYRKERIKGKTKRWLRKWTARTLYKNYMKCEDLPYER